MLQLEPFQTQKPLWPIEGRHILAQFDDRSIVVYQAFRPAIAEEAVRLQRFGPSFSLSRMSWIKPNFLWMMFRCGWATKVDQERVLALRLDREFFEGLLRQAVPSTYAAVAWPSEKEWKAAVARSDVRLQWDPDHGPSGVPVTRRAVQLGLRGSTLEAYASEALLAVEDVTPLVVQERVRAITPYEDLMVPRERVFTPKDPAAAANVRLDAWS